MIQIQIYLGETTTVTVSAEDEKVVIEQAAFFNNLPRACPVCAANVVFTFRKPKGFTFYGLRCLGPTQHEATFGQHKEGGKLFYKESESWKQFRVEQETEQPVDEHDQLDGEIRSALKVLKKTEADFNGWVQGEYETDSEWKDLSLTVKRELLAHLLKWMKPAKTA